MLAAVSRISHPAGMGKKRGTVLAVLFVALAGGLVWMLSRLTEPAYQGKPLRLWLNEFNGFPPDTNEAVVLAFRAMGTNAIPALLRIIQSREPPFERLFSKLDRMQSLVHFPLREAWNQRWVAPWALYAMGANAKPAFPTLTNLLFHTSNRFDRAVPLLWMGSGEEQIIQASCPDFLSAVALAGMGSAGVPPLLAALTNQNEFLRYSAATALAWERSDLNLVVPALIARLSDQNVGIRRIAVEALGQLHAEPGLAVPALMKDYPVNDRWLLRSPILIALGRFETNASAAVPMLLESLTDSHQEVRIDAASALKQIDPAAAAKAGVK